jgi:hypothetical protein
MISKSIDFLKAYMRTEKNKVWNFKMKKQYAYSKIFNILL